MNRKVLLTMGVGLVGAALTATSMVSAAGVHKTAQVGYYPGFPKYTGTANLTWWTWVPNYQGEVKIFEKYYPNIHVKALNVGAGTPEYTKLNTVIAAKHGAPDVVMLEFGMLPQFIQTGGLLNIAKYVAPQKKDFPSWVWNLVSYNNNGQAGVYAAPEDTGPMGLYYRTDVFAQNHLAVPKTWAQFFSEALAYHKKTGKQFTDFFVNDGQWLQGLMWDAGLTPFKQVGNNKWQVNIDTPTAVKLFSEWGNLVKAGAAGTLGDWSPAWQKALAKGQFAALEACAWFPSEAFDEILPKKPNYHWHATSSPNWTPGVNINGDWGGSSQAVTTQTKYPEAAAIFAMFINSAAPELPHDVGPVPQGGGGLFPAATAGFKTPAFGRGFPSLDGQPAYTQVFAKAAKQVDLHFQFSPWSAYFYNELSVESASAAAGKETWSQALQKVQQNVVQFAQQQGYQITT